MAVSTQCGTGHVRRVSLEHRCGIVEELARHAISQVVERCLSQFTKWRLCAQPCVRRESRLSASYPRVAPARVCQFWEKPILATAYDLQRRGCLWNTFVTIGRVSTFIDVLCLAAPNAMLVLSAGILENDLDSSYRSIPSIDFSRDVLASQPARLLVIRDAVSGWTDLGNPNRVFDTLARERIAPAWLESIRGVEMPVAG
jgi:hypothetical protein